MQTIPFIPNNASSPPFQTQVVLDGNPYLLATRWNFYRAYWYVSISSQNGVVVCNQPLIGSPPMQSIPLFPGFFKTSTITYTPFTQNFVVVP